METTTLRAEQIQGLRELANWLEAHPDLACGEYDTIGIQVYGAKREQVAIAARAGATFDKRYLNTIFEGVVTFTGGVKYEINADRSEVCVKRVVGVTHHEERVVPAHDEEIVEWDCQPILDEVAS